MASTMRFDNWQTTDGASIATTNASGDITFAGAVAGAGKILQVVQTTVTGSFNTTSSTLVDVSGFSATITPSSTSSKVLVQVSAAIYRGDASTTRLSLFRGNAATGTNLAAPAAGFGLFREDFSPYGWASMTYLDSPSTTSATTYQVAMAAINGGTASTQGEMKTIILMEVSA